MSAAEVLARLETEVQPGSFQRIGGWAHAIPPERLADIRAVVCGLRAALGVAAGFRQTAQSSTHVVTRVGAAASIEAEIEAAMRGVR